MLRTDRPDSSRADAPSVEELEDAIQTARQNYECAVATTERLAAEVITATRRLGVAISRREDALLTLTRLEHQRP